MTLFPQLSNFLFSPRHRRGLSRFGYNFTVNISDGIVTHPNLVKFNGYVAKSGSVHASVTVHDKFASGTGRLFGTSGRGKRHMCAHPNGFSDEDCYFVAGD